MDIKKLTKKAYDLNKVVKNLIARYGIQIPCPLHVISYVNGNGYVACTAFGDDALYSTDKKNKAIGGFPDSFWSRGTFVLPGFFNYIPAAFSYSPKAGSIGGNVTYVFGKPTYNKVGAMAFYYCDNLASIPFRTTDGTVFGENSFYGCASLTNLKITGKRALEYSFGKCFTKISNRKLKLDIKCLHGHSFQECTTLTKVWLSKGTMPVVDETASRSYGPFFGCTNLTDIYLEADAIPEDWSNYWNYIDKTNGRTTAATIHLSTTEEEFDAL